MCKGVVRERRAGNDPGRSALTETQPPPDTTSGNSDTTRGNRPPTPSPAGAT